MTWIVGIVWCLSAAVVVTYIAVSEYLDNRWKRALKRSVRDGRQMVQQWVQAVRR